MKKLFILLFIVFLSCEKSDIDNELVGTEWYGTDEYVFTYEKSGPYNEWLDPETGMWVNDKFVSIDFIEEYTFRFISNDEVIIDFYGHSVDLSIGTDVITRSFMYVWNSNNKTGVVVSDEETSTPFVLQGDGKSILYGSDRKIKISKLTN